MPRFGCADGVAVGCLHILSRDLYHLVTLMRSVGSPISAIPRQKVIAFLGLDSHLLVKVAKAGLVALVLHLLFGVGTERLKVFLSRLEAMLREGGTEASRDL